MFDLNTFPIKKDGEQISVLKSLAIWLIGVPAIAFLVIFGTLCSALEGDEASQAYVKETYDSWQTFLSSIPLWVFGVATGSLCLMLGLLWS